MDLGELLDPERVVRLEPASKETIITQLCERIGRSDAVQDVDALRTAVLEREAILSTGIGLGLAVPHAKIESVTRFVAAMGLCHDGIEYGSIDHEAVKIVVLIAGPAGDNQSYLRILSRFTSILRLEDNRRALLAADIPDGVLQVMHSPA